MGQRQRGKCHESIGMAEYDRSQRIVRSASRLDCNRLIGKIRGRGRRENLTLDSRFVHQPKPYRNVVVAISDWRHGQ
jgi:hypothetical protein